MKRRKWKERVIASALAVIMTAGCAFGFSPNTADTVNAAEVTASEDGLLAYYPLETDAKDISGNKKDAVISGQGVTFKNSALSLPGGAKSNKNYVILPEGLFDGKNEVTISMWIKNNNTKINTSAFSFGGKEMQGNYPKYYFILNPCNPDGYYKAVMTDAAAGSTANPWTTEAGVNNGFNNSVSTTGYMNQWAHYTIVITENSLTGYLDGKLVGTGAVKNQKVSDFGTGLVSYIGASNYADDTFAGDFRELKIYGKELSAQDVSSLYTESANILKVRDAKGQLSVGGGLSIAEDLDLPEKAGDCSVTWKSSDPSVIETSGKVHFQDVEKEVILTATVTYGSYSEEKVFAVKVASSDEAKAGKYRTALSIPRYISGNLQKEAGKEKITWSSVPEGVVKADGTVIRPEAGKGNQKVTVSAKIGDGMITKEVTVMEKGGQILSYVIEGGNLYEETGDLLAAKDSRRSDALFLAAKTDDADKYETLNKGKAILYIKWDGDQKAAQDNQMGSPVLFRTAEGTLGVAASGNNNKDGIYVWDSTDKVTFENERYLKISDNGKAVCDPDIVYDEVSASYKVFWQDKAGNSYVTLMDNLKAGSVPAGTMELTYEKPEVKGTVPTNAVKAEASVFEAGKEEYDALTRKYGKVYNTGVEKVEIQAEPGEEVTLPETIKASYNDGSTKNLGVVWDEEDLDKLDTGKEGTYKIKGEVKQDAYAYPFIAERADPHVFYNEDDGYYYSTGSYYEANMSWTNENQARDMSYRKLDIRRAKTIEGLKTAPEAYIRESKIGDRWGSFFWAPEFHKINGKWYCLVGAHDFGTGGIKSNTDFGWCSNSILIPYNGTMEQMKNGGMLDASQWGEPIILNLPSNAGASFDVSYYEDESGQGYYVIPRNAEIYITKVKGGEGVIPHADGTGVRLKGGEWPWEYGVWAGSITASNPEGNDQLVVEGPYLFEYGDKVYISYSGATVDKFYTLGLMMADKGSDIMDPGSWTNVTYPLLSSYDTEDGQIGGGAHVGGGHNSIVLDEYGNLALVYHARPYPDPHVGMAGVGGLFDPCRHTVVKSVNVAYDGTLIFNMTAEEELDPAYKTVEASVTIKKSEPVTSIFDDVNVNDWFVDPVQFVYDRKIMKGINEKQFAPADDLGRGQFATILYRMEGSPKIEYTPAFPDVPKGEFYTEAVLWASSKNIIKGYSEGTFGPADNITREQMAVMMHRYAKYKGYDTSVSSKLNFPDSTDVSEFSEEAMKWVVGMEIITGNKDGTLAPQGNASRAVCATIIQRFMEAYK